MTSPSGSEPRTPPLYHAALAPAGAVALVVATGVASVVVGTVLHAAGAPEEAQLAAATLLGGSAWLLEAVAWGWLAKYGDTKPIEHAIDAPNIVLAFAVLAVLAPAAEEILFRGVLLRALASRLCPGAAIAISAAVF